MVLVEQEQFRSRVYEAVKRDACSGGSTVCIFVSRDVDATCACRVLEKMLKSDHILYQIVPVGGYQELQEEYEEFIVNSDEVKSVFMINCGGILDLSSAFAGIKEGIMVYVLDSHRPLRYENVINEQIVVLDDGSSIEALTKLDESDDEDEDSGKRRRMNEDGTYEDSPPSPRSKARARNRRFKNYYVGSFYGPTSAGLAYKLAQQMDKSNQELLWLAIVSLTEQYLHERIPHNKYVTQVSDYVDEVSRLTSSESAAQPVQEQEPSVVRESHSISFDEEYKFPLYRHWSLWEAVHHSRYIATKIEPWTTPGEKKLKELFAQLGIKIEDAQQRWTHMGGQVKKNLKDLIDDVAPEFGLPDCRYGSFYLQQGFRFCISAADVVHAVTAMLARTSDAEDDVHLLRRNFWVAHDALSSLESTKKIEEGIELGVTLQEVVQKCASHMLQKKAVTTSGVFRYAYLKDSADAHMFSSPHAITELAEFMATYYKEKFPNKKPKPFVLCALQEKQGTYVVVGVDGTPTTAGAPETDGSTPQFRNKFGSSFAKAAERTNARVKHDAFDTSIIEVQKDDIYNFMEFLHSGLC